MQMQHFNHNIWEKHIFSLPSHNSKTAILIFLKLFRNDYLWVEDTARKYRPVGICSVERLLSK